MEYKAEISLDHYSQSIGEPWRKKSRGNCLKFPEKKIRKSDQFRLTLRLREELDFIMEKKIRKSDQFRLTLRWREKLDKLFC